MLLAFRACAAGSGDPADYYNGQREAPVNSFKKGILVGVGSIVGVWLLGAVVTFAILGSGGGGPRVEPDSALEVHLSGAIPEYVEFNIPDLLGGQERDTATLLNQIRAIRAAADDERIKALVLRCNWSAGGWARAQELRWAIAAFKESGKPVWAFLEVAGREDYYVAALADRIVLQPETYLNLTGLRMEVMFFKGAMDKLGIEADLIRTGRYKSAGEPFSREEMSPEWRQVLNETLDEFLDQLLEGIAEGRGSDAAHWRTVLDQGPFTAAQARETGLSDDILYEDEFYEQLTEAVGLDEEIDRIGISGYVRSSGPGRLRGGKTFALLHAAGPISSGSEDPTPFGTSSGTLASRSFISRLDGLREDDSVDGVILRIDSPGGDAIASEQILRAVRRLAAEKPMVVSMANVAASGGYYIAAVPDVPILAYPGTYTGSIGVFTIHLNLRSLYDKLGINKEILVRGENAAIESDYRPLSPSERAKLSGYVDSIYDTFLERVSEGRGMPAEQVAELAEGRVWIGSQASENGLVDGLGGYLDAIDRLREAAGLEEGEAARIVVHPERRSILETILSGRHMAFGPSQAMPLKIPGMQVSLAEAAWWAQHLRNGPVAMAPHRISVQ